MNLDTLSAADLMHPQVEQIAADVTLRLAAEQMSRAKVYCLLIPPELPGGAYGVVTSKDIVQVLCRHPATVLEELRVADVMARPAISVQETMSVRDCLNLMRMTGVRRVPVLRGAQLVGILSFTDVFEHVVRNTD